MLSSEPRVSYVEPNHVVSIAVTPNDPVVQPALGLAQHRSDRWDERQGHRRSRGLGLRDRRPEHRRGRHGHGCRLLASRPLLTTLGQPARSGGRRRRRRERPGRRLERLGLRERRQRPVRRPPTRHARLGNDRRGRKQRRRRRRGQLEREDHGAQVPELRRLGHDRGCDRRDALRGGSRRRRVEQLLGWGTIRPGAARRDRVRRLARGCSSSPRPGTTPSTTTSRRRIRRRTARTPSSPSPRRTTTTVWPSSRATGPSRSISELPAWASSRRRPATPTGPSTGPRWPRRTWQARRRSWKTGSRERRCTGSRRCS